MPQFGTPIPGARHRERPAAFGVAERDGLIAVVRITQRTGAAYIDLPGGALDPGEDEIAALVREFGEETGLVVSADGRIEAFGQYFTLSGGEPVNNRATVFAVAVLGEDPRLKIEDDHALEWIDPADAVRRLRHDGHAWAVAKWMRSRS